ncbi:MAG: S8 family serine peptidase [Saprospiraceae bacterium]
MRLLSILALFLFTLVIHAQKLDHRLGYLIVQVENKASLNSLLQKNSSRLNSPVQLEKTLSERLGIHVIRFDHGRVHQDHLLASVRSARGVILAQHDHITTLRAIPNDPLFHNQWQWFNDGQTGGLIDADTDAELAWDITQGGVTALGDTIVVAIVDDGLGYNHEDIRENTWINHAEIPGNNIDDDANGYVYDVYGWNVYRDNGEVLREGHGLLVAGMVGATGNNEIGIAGINWHVKLMTVVGGTPESSAIAAYGYVLDQRILYNETNGQKGAFIVSTNSSWGIDYGQPADAPLWCGFYDILGQHGILSAAATSNAEYNVDDFGDLPTACPSEFLMSVTALNQDNERTFSAFGLEHIDFGAPGDNVFTTVSNNSYGHGTGTSFASPVAAGLVALLYSAPVLSVAELAHKNPRAAARFIRNIIFAGVEPDPVLEHETKYGGSLNAFNSMNLLLKVSSECSIPFDVESEVLSDEEVVIRWVTLDTVDSFNARYRPIGAINWTTLTDVNYPLLLTDLIGCTEYEVQLESVCADTTEGFQESHIFETEGCCELPAEITVEVHDNSFHASWSHVFAAEYFLIQWRLEGDPEWNEEVTSLNEVTIENLQPCSFYEFRLLTNCDTTLTGFSDIVRIRTTNCGNCIDLTYCEGGSETANAEYIDSLIIGPLTNHSGFNSGYAFFENLNPTYVAGQMYDVFLRPGFTFQSFDEQIRIWIDFNQDGEFDEIELVLDTILDNNDPVLLSELSIPEDAVEGSTRMRVSMAGFDPFNFNQEPCDIIQFGEVEDYCITIQRDNNTCFEVDTVKFDGITFTSAFMFWPPPEGAIAYVYRYREVGTGMYTELATVDTFAVLEGLTKCDSFEVQVRTICMADTTPYNRTYIIGTDCDVAVTPVEILLASFKVFPNPTSDIASVQITSLETGNHQISIFNTQGVRLTSRKIFAEKDNPVTTRLDEFSNYSTGLYFIVVEKDGIATTRKLIKI